MKNTFDEISWAKKKPSKPNFNITYCSNGPKGYKEFEKIKIDEIDFFISKTF